MLHGALHGQANLCASLRDRLGDVLFGLRLVAVHVAHASGEPVGIDGLELLGELLLHGRGAGRRLELVREAVLLRKEHSLLVYLAHHVGAVAAQPLEQGDALRRPDDVHVVTGLLGDPALHGSGIHELVSDFVDVGPASLELRDVHQGALRQHLDLRGVEAGALAHDRVKVHAVPACMGAGHLVVQDVAHLAQLVDAPVAVHSLILLPSLLADGVMRSELGRHHADALLGLRKSLHLHLHLVLYDAVGVRLITL
mmetsp:Transcript_44637/g.115483  ORF Transcript_44637/g.115483 Transcript_44637/m.115483 type:complete len:254 (-) Transcript_44637:571-1332(-)